MQMPRTVAAIELLNKNNIPYIVILTDPTTGGVTASFAMLADITVAEKGSTIGFAGKRVIQDTIREELPIDFQKAEYLARSWNDRYCCTSQRIKKNYFKYSKPHLQKLNMSQKLEKLLVQLVKLHPKFIDLSLNRLIAYY